MKKADEITGVEEICKELLAGKKPKISEAQSRILQRYQMVVDYYKELQTTKPELEPFEIRPAIKKKLVQECGVSLYQAGIDYYMATQYFNLGSTISKKELNIEIEINECSDHIERCIKNGSYKEAALFQRNKIELLKMQSNNVSFDYAANPLPTIRIQFNPKLLKGSTVKQSLFELYEEIETIEKSMGLDSRNHKASSLLTLFDVSDVEFQEVENE